MCCNVAKWLGFMVVLEVVELVDILTTMELDGMANVTSHEVKPNFRHKVTPLKWHIGVVIVVAPPSIVVDKI